MYAPRSALNCKNGAALERHKGFVIVTLGSSGPGMNASAPKFMRPPKMINHPTIHQRRDGGRPVGKNKISNTLRSASMEYGRTFTHSISSPAGKAPGRTNRA